MRNEMSDAEDGTTGGLPMIQMLTPDQCLRLTFEDFRCELAACVGPCEYRLETVEHVLYLCTHHARDAAGRVELVLPEAPPPEDETETNNLLEAFRELPADRKRFIRENPAPRRRESVRERFGTNARSFYLTFADLARTEGDPAAIEMFARIELIDWDVVGAAVQADGEVQQ